MGAFLASVEMGRLQNLRGNFFTITPCLEVQMKV